MADLGRMVPVSSGRAAVILVPCVVRYHWRSLLRADATSADGSAQVYHDVPDLRVVCIGPPGRS